MNHCLSRRFLGLLLGTMLLGFSTSGFAQQNPEDPPADTNPPATAVDDLAIKQGQVADKYRRLEELIFKMADYESASNPRRSALLKQAY